jgi:hypothetical protein
VEKVYKRYFLCGGRKWQIGGFMRCIGGDDWNRPTIRRATPEDIAEVSAAMRRRAVVNNEWRKEDQAVIDAVHAIITATAPRQAPNPSDKPAGSTP